MIYKLTVRRAITKYCLVAHGDLGNVDDPRTLVVEEFRIVFAPEDLVNGVPQPDIVHFLGKFGPDYSLMAVHVKILT